MYYAVRNNKIILINEDAEMSGNCPSIMYDENTGALLKHGDVRNNQIVLINEDAETPINCLSVMYDKNTGALLKHGEARDVQNHYDDYYKRLKDICPEMANAAVFVTLDNIDPEKACAAVNKAIAVSGSTARIIKQLMADKPEEEVHWILEDGKGNGICPKCNRQDKIDPLAKYCRYCGTAISLNQTAGTANE